MKLLRRSRPPLPWPGSVLAWRLSFLIAFVLVVAGVAVTLASTSEAYIILATTTSARDSGLLDYILPEFSRDLQIGVRYVAVGTGHALDMGRRGDADVVLVHAPSAEMAFVAEGHGLCRSPVMHNEFIVVGPSSDPAGIHDSTNATLAFSKILASRALFVSRGDRSGTHAMELSIWASVGYTPTTVAEDWYREAGSGMGGTLEVASEIGGYTLTDDATFLVRRGTLALEIMVQADPALQNFYHVIPVDPVQHPNVRAAWAVEFAKWLVSPRGQTLIGSYRLAGEPLFHLDGQDLC